MAAAASEFASNTMCLFLDEFQVTDIADAMILKRFFNLLWQKGVVLMTSSNRVPEDLYINGIQRATFLPFIPLLRTHSKVFHLNSDIDFRHQMIQKEKEFFSKIYYGKNNKDSEDVLFKTYFCLNNDKDHNLFR